MFCSEVVHLPELFEKYSDRAQFLLVYGGEWGMLRGTHSHPLPEAISDFDELAGVGPGSRRRLAERVRAGKKHFGLKMTFLLDDEQCQAQSAFVAFPKRLIIVDADGRIALDSGRKPTAPFPWKEVTDWLDHYGNSASEPAAEIHG